MKLTWFIAAAALTAGTAAAQSTYRPPVRVTTSCIGDRCAVYANGRRAGSVTRDMGRYVVRDKRGRVVAKIAPR